MRIILATIAWQGGATMKLRLFAVFVVAALLLGLGTLAGACGDNGNDEDAIRATVEELAEVLNERDFDRLAEMVTADFLDVEPTAEALEEALKELEGLHGPYPIIRNLEILAVVVEGDQATAAVERQGEDGGKIPATVRLVKQDGRWLVDALPRSS
jgi:ketosteroid isomerase-like protein